MFLLGMSVLDGLGLEGAASAGFIIYSYELNILRILRNVSWSFVSRSSFGRTTGGNFLSEIRPSSVYINTY
jgi:hypothetical protein